MNDRNYMHHAIDLARKGEGWVNPDPLAGAVIVKDTRVIGRGWQHHYGGPHAVREALKSLQEPAEGATLYVTMEPCRQNGKEMPCTDAIIEHGISRVVIGSRNPDPEVSGKGIQILRENGIRVEEDFMRKECDALNDAFFRFAVTGLPYVRMKYAMTADGKIATKDGKSRWITSEESRERVHRWRNACMGILTGIGTILAVDPLLRCGIEGGKDPIRIICDTNLRIPEEAQVCRTADKCRTIVVCGVDFDKASLRLRMKKERLQQMGVEVWSMPGRSNSADAAGAAEDPSAREDRPAQDANGGEQVGISLSELMARLGEEGIDSILIEGGSALNESALREEIVQEVDVFVAPKVFGGVAKSPVEGEGISLPDQAMEMSLIDVEQVGKDLLIRYML